MLIMTQGLGEYDNIEPSLSSSSTLVVSFKQRFEAEKLFYGSKDIPGVGKVEMSWVSVAASSTRLGRGDDDDVKMEGASGDGTGGIEKMGAATNGGGGGGGGKAAEQDFDVAEEDFDVA